jgi:hypothetical protein
LNDLYHRSLPVNAEAPSTAVLQSWEAPSSSRKIVACHFVSGATVGLHPLTSFLAKLEEFRGYDTTDEVLSGVHVASPAVSVSKESGRMCRIALLGVLL